MRGERCSKSCIQILARPRSGRGTKRQRRRASQMRSTIWPLCCTKPTRSGRRLCCGKRRCRAILWPKWSSAPCCCNDSHGLNDWCCCRRVRVLTVWHVPLWQAWTWERREPCRGHQMVRSERTAGLLQGDGKSRGNSNPGFWVGGGVNLSLMPSLELAFSQHSPH